MRTDFNLYCTLQTLSHDEGLSWEQTSIYTVLFRLSPMMRDCHENRLQSILYSSDSLPWWGAVMRTDFNLYCTLQTLSHDEGLSWEQTSIYNVLFRLSPMMRCCHENRLQSILYSSDSLPWWGAVMRTDFNLYCTLQTLSHDEGLSWEQTSIYTVLFRLSPMMRGCHENRLQSILYSSDSLPWWGAVMRTDFNLYCTLQTLSHDEGLSWEQTSIYTVLFRLSPMMRGLSWEQTSIYTVLFRLFPMMRGCHENRLQSILYSSDYLPWWGAVMRTDFNLYCTLQTLSHDEGLSWEQTSIYTVLFRLSPMMRGCHENRLQSIMYSSDSLPWWGAVMRTDFNLYCTLQTLSHDEGLSWEQTSIYTVLFRLSPMMRGCHENRLQYILYSSDSLPWWGAVMRTDFNLYCTLQTLSHDEGLSWEQTSIYTVLFRLSPMMRGCHENRLQSILYSSDSLPWWGGCHENRLQSILYSSDSFPWWGAVMRTDFNLYCTLQTISHDEGLSWEQTSIYTVLFRLSPMMRGCHENRLQSILYSSDSLPWWGAVMRTDFNLYCTLQTLSHDEGLSWEQSSIYTVLFRLSPMMRAVMRTDFNLYCTLQTLSHDEGLSWEQTSIYTVLFRLSPMMRGCHENRLQSIMYSSDSLPWWGAVMRTDFNLYCTLQTLSHGEGLSWEQTSIYTVLFRLSPMMRGCHENRLQSTLYSSDSLPWWGAVMRTDFNLYCTRQTLSHDEGLSWEQTSIYTVLFRLSPMMRAVMVVIVS